jgi:hypothetical protein
MQTQHCSLRRCYCCTCCHRDDLPKPYEPVVNVDGLPALAYLQSDLVSVERFSAYECLKLNDVDAAGKMDPSAQVQRTL